MTRIVGRQRNALWLFLLAAAGAALPMCRGGWANVSVPLNYRAPRMIEPVAVDGQLREWREAKPALIVGESRWHAAGAGQTYGGVTDLAARFYVAWDPTNLYMVVQTYDDDLVPPARAEAMLHGDCVVIAIDATNDASQGYDDDDSEFGFAYTPSGPLAWRWFPAEQACAFTAAKVAVAREVKAHALEAGVPPIKLTYEIAIPWSELPGKPQSAGQAGDVLGFDLAINDADNGCRRGWLEWSPGIMGVKDPSRFGNVLLAGALEPEAPAAHPRPPSKAPATTGSPRRASFLPRFPSALQHLAQ